MSPLEIRCTLNFVRLPLQKKHSESEIQRRVRDEFQLDYDK